RRSRERQLSRVVALGGGSGLPVVLRGLRRHLPPECRITAVVTAADDGGSSGVLREQYGVLPPGDIRNCLIALARVAPEVLAALPRSGVPIARLRIDPPDACPAPGVLEALRTADAVILGPGSLYTSILATLVVPGMVEAVAAAPGARILVCNLMTEPGETDGH